MLYGLLVFVFCAGGAFVLLIEIGLKRRFPREWEQDSQLSRARWQRRRERLSNIFR